MDCGRGCSLCSVHEAEGAGFDNDFNCETRWAKNFEFSRLFKSEVMNMGFNLESHAR
jgi:hypothetical protein